jgi:hypothetical protein
MFDVFACYYFRKKKRKKETRIWLLSHRDILGVPAQKCGGILVLDLLTDKRKKINYLN